jgi:hypothetical protein
MKKYSFIFLLSFMLFAVPSAYPAFAIEDPLARPNNKIGIHILSESELPQAAKLVNSNGGDWGYVTIPLSIQDMNLVKWQKFMTTAKKQHVIPIVRLVTNPHPLNTRVWRKPTENDIKAFASFLSMLEWPTKNRYIIVFNEVNRGNEWGGAANPTEYAQLLSVAVTVFKAKSPDFFIISAGLDNAAPNKGVIYMNQYDYMTQMNSALPGIFNQIDGLSSHSYPNPAFAQPPDATSLMGIGSFQHERALTKSLSGKELPMFITETGWSTDVVSDDKIVQYYQQTFDTIWNDPNIVAVTPFLLDARGGPFQKFSFLTATGEATKQYDLIKNLPKTAGDPELTVKVLAAETSTVKAPKITGPEVETHSLTLFSVVYNFFTWMKGEKAYGME